MNEKRVGKEVGGGGGGKPCMRNSVSITMNEKMKERKPCMVK
jgi:hypothetical protein